ncbi:MAG: APC family permease [Candidatus Nanopelagicales bacterium]|jgi:glutamate:GABA antiporter|nr:APC family permease [Candidatus Nanopelagicales bacterium]MDP4896132.1 APC family permease [Candidatus Nanopelagicales bacterium]MDP5050587.1 APC family permease [Candidatus Nanopelagicales bacterium]
MENDTAAKEPASQFDLTPTYLAERKNFRKDFGRKEVLFFSICSVIGLDTIAIVAAAGPQAISWMAVLAIVFLIPAAMVFAELSSTFTFQGGPYMWIRLAFGRLVGSVSSVISWLKSPIWLGGVLTIVVIAAAETFFMAGDQMSQFSFYRFALAFIWLSILANNYSFRVGKWIPVLGVLSRLILIPLFTITVIAFGIVNGMGGVAFSDFGLSFDGLILTIPIILFAFLGLENVSAASAEMRYAKRDLPYAVFRTTAFSMLVYGIPIFAVLLVLPVNRVDGITGFVDALKTIFTVYGGGIAEDGTVTLSGAGTFLGGIAGVLIILVIFSTGVTWLMSTNRNLAMACFDGSGPRWLGHTNPRYGTPVRINNITGIVASAILILGYQLNEGDLAKYFGVSVSFAIAASLVTYLGIFPAFWVLRNKYPDLTRPYRVRAHRTVAIWLTLVVAFGVSQLLAPGLGDRWFGNDYLPSGWLGDQGRPYYLTQLGVLGIMIVIAALFSFIGRIRSRVDAPQEIVEELAEEASSAEPLEPAPESENK